MKTLLLCFFYFLASAVTAQEPDTTSTRSFVNIFGMSCPETDTLNIDPEKQHYCVLQMKKLKLTREKKGRKKWTVSLNGFEECDKICMTNYFDGKNGDINDLILHITGYSGSTPVIYALVKCVSGKIIESQRFKSNR